MIKKIAILSGSILLCIIVIELALSTYNPFYKGKETMYNLEELPSLRLEIKPASIQQTQTFYIINNRIPQRYKQSLIWLDIYLENQDPNTYYKLYDLSTPIPFLQDPTKLLELLRNHTPNVLIVHLHPNMLHSILSVPDFEFYDQDLRLPILDKEPQLIKSIRHIRKNAKKHSDSFYLDFTTGVSGYTETPPATPEWLAKRVKQATHTHIRSLKKLQELAQKLGFSIWIAPYPILWDAEKSDRYTSIPLNSVVVQNNIPGLWYSTLYYNYIDQIYKAAGNRKNWIDIYKYYPKDSRFYRDGFRLNEEGQLFYYQMIQGRIKAGKLPAF